MLYYDFNAGDKAYKLRLNTRSIVLLEKNIGCNPMAIFGDGNTLPTVSTMVAILHASLQAYHHGISLTDAYDIFDEYLADGHTPDEFLYDVIEIYKASGIIKENKSEKN